MSKRPRADNAAISGPQRKRSKMQDARKINVQQASASSSRGEIQLPQSLDLEKLLQSRSFEMAAMTQAMKKAREAGSIRAWQTLPRHLRRRAASHHARRLPTRLRTKAIAEMDGEKPVKAPRFARLAMARKRYKNLGRSAVLLKRQVAKRWLETHLWHAKRMKMVNVWGFRLAEKPSEKCFRAAYRASQHGCVLHDTSYFGTIRLRGLPDAVGACLKTFCDPFGSSPTSTKFASGARQLDTLAYRRWPDAPLGPVSIIWRADPPSAGSPVRDVLVRVHPSIRKPLLELLKARAVDVRTQAHRADPAAANALQIVDLTDQILSFELTGPRATEVLSGVLRFVEPLVTRPESERREAMQAIMAGTPPAAFPSGMLIGAIVHDPRLSFPPSKENANGARADQQRLAPSAVVAQTPSVGESVVRLGEAHEPSAPKFRKRDLDRRRSQLPVPGTRLAPTPEDQKISLVLVQRTLQPSTPSARTDLSKAGWTLLLPKGWGMAFWHSLVFSNVRVGGLRERRHQDFESGVPSFPFDWPTTAAHDGIIKAAGDEAEAYWDRKPSAKRPGYRALGTPSPFKADWDALIGRPRPLPSEEHLIAAHPTASDAAPVDDQQPAPFLLAGPFALQLVAALTKVASTLSCGEADLQACLPDIFESVRSMSRWGDLGPVREEDLRSALVRCAIVPVGRGSPEDLALVYRIAEDIKAALGDGTDVEMKAPDQKNIVGYVTTGTFSLKQGNGYAIGALPLTALFSLLHQHARSSRISVAFRNKQSRAVHQAVLHVIA